MTFHPDSLPDLSGKVWIVTGGNSGVFVSQFSLHLDPIQGSQVYRGYGTVSRLAEHGAHIYMCARSPTKASNAIAEIKTLYPKANISLLETDHNSLSSVVSAANNFLSKETTLHGLINNAGIMGTPLEITRDGYEAQWQTNYLAHWVFTSHLLPIMLRTSKSLPPGSVRVVNVSSSGHFWAPKGGINLADTSVASKSNMNRYGQSKLANILHAKTLNKVHGPSSPTSKAGHGEIWTSAVDPGLVKSGLASKIAEPEWWMKLTGPMASLGLQQDADTGARSSLFCAASPDMKAEQSGTYFQQNASAGWQSCSAKDMILAAKLEDWTKVEMAKGNWVD
ncbi:putative oxidoreductase [Lachnellula occidentalis]|uniref:Putative oxidoreductase n=1 Tax=Lachnellula occidentalis TaxID=215460 RepID=A0A8H8UKP7_9HELO|nr:putative oxidoreductase [Lachnellula occidentalis]